MKKTSVNQTPKIKDQKVFFVRFWLKKILVFGFSFLVFSASVSLAQDISVQADINTSQIALGQAAVLTVTIQGTQDVAPIQIPAVDGLDIRSIGAQNQFTFSNGRQSSSIAFRYTVFGLSAGNYQIPSLNITINGQNYTTNPIDLEVVDAASVSSVPGAVSQDNSQALSLQDKIFLVLKVPKNEVYLNERLPIKILLFISADMRAEIGEYPQLEALGFNMEKFEQAKQYQQIIGGMRYDIVEFDTVIYPTRTGEIKLGPAKLDCNLMIKTDANRHSPSGRFDSFFDDDFFNSFFNNYEKRPLSVESADVALNVLPLPDEGKPENFSGAVGQFNFEASVGPSEVRVGDPLTLRMKIAGNGNLAGVDFPKLSSTKGGSALGGNEEVFKLYDPQIKGENNTKTLEQVIIPQTDQITEVPAFQFSYFDPDLKKYQAITQGPFSIEVTKPGEGESLKVVGLEGANLSPVFTQRSEILGQDIVFIKEDLGGFRRRGVRFYQSFFYYLFIFIFLSAWLSLYILYKRTHRLETDKIYARRLLAPRQARKGLFEARKLIEAEKTKEFYDALFKILEQYLANKFHLPPGAVSLENIASRLGSIPNKEIMMDDLRVILNDCEMVRFAAVSLNQENMRQSLVNLEKVIDYLERHSK